MPCGGCAKRNQEFEKKIQEQRANAEATRLKLKEQPQQPTNAADAQKKIPKVISLKNIPVNANPVLSKVVHLPVDPNKKNDPLHYKILTKITKSGKMQQRREETIAYQQNLKKNPPKIV